MERMVMRKIVRLWVGTLLVAASLLGLGLGVGSQDVIRGEPLVLNPYCTVQYAIQNGEEIAIYTIAGPPEPPPGFEQPPVKLPEPDIEAGINVLPDVPAFTWCFGCSATSAAMIAGYYDRVSHPNMYTGPTNGGVMPLDNSSWGTWTDGCSATRAQCPLSATRNGVDGRTTRGHVDDYWVCYRSTAADPYIAYGSEHTWSDCTADYMMTSRSSAGISDGGTRFWCYTSGAPWSGVPASGDDGGYGSKLFYESRGYSVPTRYNQYIYGWNGNTQGFTYDQYKAEIDAGRPVMIHVVGHTMVGLGYDDSTSNLMYIHDTWNYTTHTMTWGGSYSGMTHKGVTIVTLGPGSLPEIDVQRPTGTSIPDGGTDNVGSKTVGVPTTIVYTVRNTGGGSLSVTGATASSLVNCGGYTVNTSLPLTVAPGGTGTLSVSVTPSAAAFSFDLALANNDSNENPYNIAVTGGSPQNITVTPPTLSGGVAPGATGSLPLTIGNTGDRGLNWSVGVQNLSPPVAADHAAASGGPDTYGYTWDDSDEPGGPAYSWVDITGTGTALGLGDDGSSGAIALPFSFDFYGVAKTSIYVGSNGYLQFGGAATNWTNDPIPSTNAPDDIVCPFWDDLDPSAAGEIYYRSEASRFVVSWVGVPRFGEGGAFGNTFQAILYSDGSILFQYQTMGASSLTGATTGIENSDASDGLEVACDETYVKNGLAVRIRPPTAAVFRVASDGTVLADSTVYAASLATGAADVAEWVNVSEAVEPGDVLEFDPTAPGAYRKARGPCSATVAGVVSTEPGVVLGTETEGEKALLALAGFVLVKACDEGGPIEPGDLLVTASRSGYVR